MAPRFRIKFVLICNNPSGSLIVQSSSPVRLTNKLINHIPWEVPNPVSFVQENYTYIANIDFLNYVHFRYTSICLTKLDILDTIPKILVGVGYRLNGKEIDYFPSSTSDLAKVEVIYETIDGWQSPTEGVRSLEKLPSNARKYIQLIEELLGIPGNILLNIVY